MHNRKYFELDDIESWLINFAYKPCILGQQFASPRAFQEITNDILHEKQFMYYILPIFGFLTLTWKSMHVRNCGIYD